MVATLSQSRPKYAEHAALHEVAIPAARRLTRELLDLADEDAAAYAACAVALKLPREAFADKEYRDQQVRATAQVAAEVPLRCVERCREVLVLAEALAGRSNVNASSDLRVAALLSEAAGHGAAENVLVNIPLIGENEWTRAAETRVAQLLEEISSLKDRVHEVVSSGERRAALASVPEVAA
jgi:formiminotetrahydrofolate cyclodeaminase